MRRPVHFIFASLLVAVAASPAAAQAQFMDKEFNAQWGLGAIKAQKALAKGYTGAGVDVVVVDTQYQATHPEFAGRVGLYQYMPTPPVRHGTHVAGIIGAGRNGFGMEGVAPDVRLSSMAIFLANGQPAVTDSQFLVGYTGAVKAGIRIFNNSWAERYTDITDYTPAQAAQAVGPGHMQAFLTASQAGAVQVFGASNEPYPNPNVVAGLPYLFPQLRPGWIVVTSVEKDLSFDTDVNACGVTKYFCIAAPGVSIYSTVPPSTYARAAGTSTATPHVTGAIAIAKQMFPKAQGAQLAELVLRTATDIGAPGVDDIVGWGLLNVGNLASITDSATGSAFTNSAFGRFAATDTVVSTLWDRSAQRIMSGGSAPVAVAQAVPAYRPAMALGGPVQPADDAVFVSSGRSAAVWAQGLGAHASIDQSANSAKASVDLGGVIGGYELLDEGPWHAGFAIAYTNSNLGGIDDSSADGWHGFAYATWMNEGWFVDGIVGGNWFGNDYSRRNISGTAGTVLGNGGLTGYSSNDTSGFASRLTAGRLYAFRDYSLLPYAYGTVLYQKTGGATETGADIFSLSVNSSSINQVEGGIGARAQLEGLAAHDFSIRPSVDLAYGRLGGDVAFPVGLELLGTPIAAASADVGRNVFRIGVQLDVLRFDEMVGGFIAYDGRFQENAQNNTFSGGVLVRF